MVYLFLSSAFSNASEVSVFLNEQVNKYTSQGWILDEVKHLSPVVDARINPISTKLIGEFTNADMASTTCHVVHVRLSKLGG